jgi:hypothetical protein
MYVQEYLERAAAVFIDIDVPSNASVLAAGPSKAVYEVEADEDMFASGKACMTACVSICGGSGIRASVCVCLCA